MLRCRRFVARVLVVALVSTSGTLSLAAGAAPSYELVIAGKAYAIEADTPITIETPGGERLELRLRLKPVQHFAGHGVEFDYPAEMTVTAEADEGMAFITVESRDGPLVIVQVYADVQSPDDLLSDFAAAFRQDLESRGAAFSRPANATVTRQILDHDRRGMLLVYGLTDQQFRVELYALTKGDSVVLVMLQHEGRDAALAKKQFDGIVGSLR